MVDEGNFAGGGYMWFNPLGAWTYITGKDFSRLRFWPLDFGRWLRWLGVLALSDSDTVV